MNDLLDLEPWAEVMDAARAQDDVTFDTWLHLRKDHRELFRIFCESQGWSIEETRLFRWEWSAAIFAYARGEEIPRFEGISYHNDKN